jgi:hypothetical protein
MAPPAGADPLADAISLIGLVAVFAWIAWRFGPTLLRVAGWSWWWVAWACGSQGGYRGCVAFLVLGTVAWSVGTVWYATRRGRWPSVISERLLTRALGRHSPLAPPERNDGNVVVPRRRP